jgi:hypothetical protein
LRISEGSTPGKLRGRSDNLPLLLVQVFGSEDFGWGAGFKQKTAACGGHYGGRG